MMHAAVPDAPRPLLHVLKFEVHLAHGCNLHCESCSHYSSHGLTGTLGLSDAASWYAGWSRRIIPTRITVLGGEPALNSEFSEHLMLLRQYWPHARIWVVSNGFLLRRHPRLPETLAAIGNYRFQISKHHDSAEYQARFREVENLLRSWQAEVPGFAFTILESFRDWTSRYIDEGLQRISPYLDGDRVSSWSICPGKQCVQLHEGRLWKCAAIAYLPLLAQKRGLGEAWTGYLRYTPLALDCSDEDLRAFFSRGAEAICGMCPAIRRPLVKRNPLMAREAGVP